VPKSFQKIKVFSTYVHKCEFLKTTFSLDTCRKNQGFAGLNFNRNWLKLDRKNHSKIDKINVGKFIEHGSKHEPKIHLKSDKKTSKNRCDNLGDFWTFQVQFLIENRHPWDCLVRYLQDRTQHRTHQNDKKEQVQRWSAKVMCNASFPTPTRPRRGVRDPGPERISVAMRQYSHSGPREVGVLAVSVRAAMFKWFVNLGGPWFVKYAFKIPQIS